MKNLLKRVLKRLITASIEYSPMSMTNTMRVRFTYAPGRSVLVWTGKQDTSGNITWL